MASITKKTIRGRTYYYARECRRVNGKPKIVWQKYLGKVEDIIAALTRPPVPATAAPTGAILTDFGAVVALYDLAQRLQLTEFIDRHVPKAGAGPTVGTYLLVAALNRCVAPCSKAGIGAWFQGTALRRLVDIDGRQLTSQRFWDNMDRVSTDAIARIEEDITVHLVKEFDIDLRRVLFDATNFFTFIDTFNERCTLAQRGKSKEGRKSLRIVGLALLVSADFHVPLLHRTYPGNQADAPTFASLTSELVRRCQAITEEVEEVTLVFDKGNNSGDNLAQVDRGSYHFIGSLVPTQHPDLLKIPGKRFHSLTGAGLPDVRVYRTTKEVFGATRTIVITYNENLFVAQSQTLLREIAKRQQRLHGLQTQLRRWQRGKVRGGRAPTIKGARQKVAALLKARHMRDLFHVAITERRGVPHVTYHFDNGAWQHLQKTLLGKTIIFTDNHHWGEAEIVRGYRGQHHVERAFRTMKDPHHICLRPQYHWTDQKIAVHVFCCILALTLGSLLRREAYRKGIDRSIPGLLDELGRIREVGVVYARQGKQSTPAIVETLSEMSADQRALYDALDLKRYRAT